MSKMKTSRRKIDIKKVCRACLGERGHLREIFTTKIPKMMESCADIEVSDKDELPSQVCVSCFHLIARFYAFKKKLEKSDRVLRNVIKQNKLKQKNILDIAMSEAQIEQLYNEEESDVEDIPLSERKDAYKAAKVKGKVKARKTPDTKSNSCEDVIEERVLIIKSEEKCENDEISNVDSQIFTNDGPPPLVPLEPTKKVIEGSDQSDMLKNLPADPPPLIPIKPLVVLAENILTNVIENPIELNLECSNCSLKFSSLTALKEHKLNICKDTSLQCNICHKEFKERKRLIGHLKGHMVVKDYGCKICGKRYPNPSTFRVHMRTHTGERPFKCQICNKGFVRWAGVVGHMRTHQPHKPYKCETCGKEFKISSNLERHKVLHMDSLPFCCDYCGRRFSQSDNLQLHIRTYHTNERPYLCNECGKGFVSSTRLNRHMWVHTGFKPYRCSSCSKAYSNSNDLKNHERNHHSSTISNNEDKPYACKLCQLRFYHHCRLMKHMKTHEKPFSCNACLKNFSTSALLEKHLNAKKCIAFIEVEEMQEETDVNEIFLEY